MSIFKSKPNPLEKRIESLELEVNGPKEKEKYGSMYEYFLIRPIFYTRTLKERVDSLEKRVDKQDKLINTILNHFKLEFVKVTEENGETHVTEKLRPQKKKKKQEESEDDEY